MAGFVDPEFKRLKPTEPKFLVYRISKLPEENYEVKRIENVLVGQFFEEECYIVYCASPVKRPLGNLTKVLPWKMEIHIHFWLGSSTSAAETKRAILKATELDDILEGAAVLHREVQGSESNRFLSYFKNGMKINRKTETGPGRAGSDSEFNFYKLTEKSSTWVLTEQTTLSWTEFDAKNIFILDTTSRLFIWVGQKAKNTEKYLALKFGKQMEGQTEKKIVWVLDGQENDMDQEDLRDFELFLDLKSKTEISNSVESDYMTMRTKTRNVLKLYEVMDKEEGNVVVHIKDGSLLQSDLSQKKICIIDHGLSGIWVWVSRKTSEVKRSRAINIGIAYFESKPNADGFPRENATVSRVVEGAEPVEFKLLFVNWSDNCPLNAQQYFAKVLTKPVNARFSADQLEENRFLAADTQLIDYGSGTMRILRVNETLLEPLTAEEFGIFHSDYSYLVHYSYVVTEEKKSVLYHWLGCNAPRLEKERPIWGYIKDIPDLNDAEVLVRMMQFKETPHFYAIFRGKFLILTRKATHFSLPADTNPLDVYPVILLHIEGGDVLNTRSVEVEPVASSLNPFNVYLLRTPKLSYVWCGSCSRGDEREMAKQISNRWTRDYKVIFEGREDAEFWVLLQGKGPYTKEQKIQQIAINFPARLFKCLTLENDLRASEIVNFTQSDLNSHDIAILDCWRTVFVWSGIDVADEERFEGERLVHEYLRLDPCSRDLDVPITHIRQGHEPPTFTGFFANWDKNFLTQSYDDSVKTKLFNRKREREGATTEDKTAGASDETATVPPCDGASDKFQLQFLKRKNPEELPPGVDPTRKEDYLTDEDFFEAFGMTRLQFHGLPLWRRKHLKINAGLF